MAMHKRWVGDVKRRGKTRIDDKPIPHTGFSILANAHAHAHEMVVSTTVNPMGFVLKSKIFGPHDGVQSQTSLLPDTGR